MNEGRLKIIERTLDETASLLIVSEEMMPKCMLEKRHRQ
jgi:hypothetical protein